MEHSPETAPLVAVVEIPKGVRNKYEYDRSSEASSSTGC